VESAGRLSPLAKSVLLGLLLVVFLGVLVKTAWLCDDAYITFRTIDNFNSGYGLRWNVTERVQVFTHPLWMFLLSSVYHYTQEIYYSAIVVSILISAIATGLVAFGTARTRAAGVLAVSVLILSVSFVDFSTSGLENPLTHLLLALFFLVAMRSELTPRILFWLSLIAGLAAFNRMDTILLYLPLLAVAYWRVDKLRGLGAMTLGLVPFALWAVFSLFYYGFLFPNTAYAKLQTGVARADLVAQGFHYLIHSAKTDPLIPLCLAAGGLAAWANRSRRSGALLVGLVCYLSYIVMIGGDFMAGRFASPVLFGSALLVSRIDLGRVPRLAYAGTFAALIGVGLLAAGYRTWGADDEQILDRSGIADERRVYYRDLGLLQVIGREGPPEHPWARKGLELRADNEPVVQLAGGVGLMGFYAGPVAHILDVHGVCDPLLARLPANPDWRIGHFVREPRIDYIHSLQAGRNLIVDRDLSRYYEKLFLITRGKLFDRRRLVEIARFNLGRNNSLLDGYLKQKALRDASQNAR
jgi:arabinofuranosyltransferase